MKNRIQKTNHWNFLPVMFLEKANISAFWSWMSRLKLPLKLSSALVETLTPNPVSIFYVKPKKVWNFMSNLWFHEAIRFLQKFREKWKRSQFHRKTQFGNSIIFLSLGFYVKSILGIIEVLKLAIFANLEAVNFVLLVNFNLKIVQKFIKSKLGASKCVKMAEFELQESLKLISRKI